MSNQASTTSVGPVAEAPAEAIGQPTLEEARLREAILTKARGYRGTIMVPVFAWLGYMACIASTDGEQALVPMIAIMGLLIYLEFHSRGINSRIDALLKLADFDKSRATANPAEVADGQPAADAETK